MFNAFDTVYGADVQIMGCIELWRYTSCKVFYPVNSIVYKVVDKQL
jgi:hypothetical protein